MVSRRSLLTAGLSVLTTTWSSAFAQPRFESSRAASDRNFDSSQLDAVLPRAKSSNSDFLAVAYYYPSWYHSDAMNRIYRQPFYSEWDVLSEAEKKHLPHVPVPKWGHYNDTNPSLVEREIDLAAEAGIGAFMYDWYYDDGMEFYQKPLDVGLLQSRNKNKIKFAILWCNQNNLNGRFRFDYSRFDFEKMADVLCEKYLKRTNYWRIAGRPVFGVLSVRTIVQAIGVKGLRSALEKFRHRVAASGVSEPYIIACQDHYPKLRSLGFDGATNYQTIDTSHSGTMSYRQAALETIGVWERKHHNLDVPYFPDCPVGWNNSPRTSAGSGRLPLIVTSRSADQYKVLLEGAKRFIVDNDILPRLVFLSSWNEWTEGHYILPDQEYGSSYLNAIKSEFGRNS